MLFQRIKIFLDRQNIEHRNISDTMLVFSKNGLNYLFQHDQSEDENYFRLILPQIDRVETLPDSMFRTIAQINANYKVAKIIGVPYPGGPNVEKLAKVIKIKKSVPQILPPGISKKIRGSVTNISDGPSDGSTP